MAKIVFSKHAHSYKLAVVKFVKEMTGESLKKAKDMVDVASAGPSSLSFEAINFPNCDVEFLKEELDKARINELVAEVY